MVKSKIIRFNDDVVKLVDDWRSTQRPIPNFNEAVNKCLFDYLTWFSNLDPLKEKK